MTADELRARKARWNREWRHRTGRQRPRPSRPFTFQPLMDAAMLRVEAPDIPCADIGQAYRLLGVSSRLVSNWRIIGLSAYDADRCAVALGLHPSEIYGRAWFTELDAVCA